MLKIAINGFGRIGRLSARLILTKYQHELELTSINTSGRMDNAGWANLLKYDSSYGKIKADVGSDDTSLIINGRKINIYGEKDPEKIPWQKDNPELVLECTGALRRETDIRKLLGGSIKKVVLSAPPKEGNVPMYVIGINDNDYHNEDIVSCASCTTNCVAPAMFVLNKNIGIKKAMLNTIHAYTSDQRLLDGSHKDPRRARSAGVNIVPTSTGAAKAAGQVIKELRGIFDGLAVRVPVAVGSLADLVILTKRKTTIDEVNSLYIEAEKTYLKNILQVSKDDLVSSDIIGNSHSCVIDTGLTNVVDGDMLRVVGWYDNEWGYTNRLVELAKKINK